MFILSHCNSLTYLQVLHRLDHSIHTMRLYVATIAKKLCSDWNMSTFFKVVHNDMNLCLEQLNDLRLPGKMNSTKLSVGRRIRRMQASKTENVYKNKKNSHSNNVGIDRCRL